MAQKSSSHEIEKPRSRPKRKDNPALVQASGIPVYCGFTKIVPAAELKPDAQNANTHPAKQLDRYEKVIEKNGWRKSVVVSDLSGCIVKGHGAWQSACRRGWDVPVEIQSYRTRAEEIRDMLADNKLASLAETDDDKLAALLSSLDAGEIEFTGFDASELEKLLQENVTSEGEFPITAKLGEGYDYVLIFTTNETEFVYLQNLLGVRQENSYKKTAIGLGRAIPFERAIAALRANRHSLDVQGGEHDHTPADPKRAGLRAGQPAKRVSGSRPKAKLAHASGRGQRADAKAQLDPR